MDDLGVPPIYGNPQTDVTIPIVWLKMGKYKMYYNPVLITKMMI